MAEKAKKETKPLWFVRVSGPTRNEYNPPTGEIYKSELHIPFLVVPKDMEYFRKRLAPKKCFVELGLKLPEEYSRVAKTGKAVPSEPEEVKEEKANAEAAALAEEKKGILNKGSTGAAANQIQKETKPEEPKPTQPADAGGGD